MQRFFHSPVNGLEVGFIISGDERLGFDIVVLMR